MTRSPRFSYVVATYERPQHVRDMLLSMQQLDYAPRDFEVLVVDDGGVAPLENVVAEARSHLDVRLLREAHYGPAAARNAGVASAAGEYVVFIDDDCRPARNMLHALERRVHLHPDAAIGGRTLNALETNVFSTATQELIDAVLDYHERARSAARFFPTTNLTVSRKRFLAAGGFDTSFRLAAAEDRDLCERLFEQGTPMVFAAEVVVRHHHALTLRSFARQHFNYGRGRDDLVRSRRRRGATTGLDSPDMYGSLLTTPLSRHGVRRGLPIAMLNVLSQAAYAAGYFSARLSR